MEHHEKRILERRIFGGTNFIVVLWTLISIFRLVRHMTVDPVETFKQPEFYIFILPLIFLTVLNIIMGITLFFPQESNKMWIISILIVSATLLALNTLQLKIESLDRAQMEQQNRTLGF